MTRSEQIEKWFLRSWIKARTSEAVYLNIRGYNVSVFERSENCWSNRILERGHPINDATFENNFPNERAAKIAVLGRLADILDI